MSGMQSQGGEVRGESGSLEIERKYLLDGLPALPEGVQTWRIEQGYIERREDDAADAGSVAEIRAGGRVRRAVEADGTVRCTHTVKQGSGLVRREVERRISEAEFERIWRSPAVVGLRKTRYRVPVGERVWEIDAFADLDLVLAEVELPHAEAEAEPPAWLARHIVREVTEEAEYRNYAIAKRMGEKGK